MIRVGDLCEQHLDRSVTYTAEPKRPWCDHTHVSPFSDREIFARGGPETLAGPLSVGGSHTAGVPGTPIGVTGRGNLTGLLAAQHLRQPLKLFAGIKPRLYSVSKGVGTASAVFRMIFVNL